MTNYESATSYPAMKSWISTMRKLFPGHDMLYNSLDTMRGKMPDMQVYLSAKMIEDHIRGQRQAREPVHWYVPIREGNTFRYVDFGYKLRNPERYRGHFISEHMSDGTFAFIIGDEKMIPRFLGRGELQEVLRNNTMDPGVSY